MYKLKGELKVINDSVQVSDSFKKREFVVIDASGQYAQTILFQTVQDRCEVLDNFKVGDSVEVTFFLRGREWTNPKTNEVRFFNSLDACKIEPLGAEQAPTAEQMGDDSEELGDLPF